MDGVRLELPCGMLPYDMEFFPKRISQPDKISDAYTFYNSSFPLFGWAKISLKLNCKVKDTSKLYISTNFGSRNFVESVYANGWVTGRMRELGAVYDVAYDDTPPVINVGEISGKSIRCSIYDTGSGIKSFKGYVDGRFVLFEKIERSNVMLCRLPDVPVRKTGGTHLLKVIVTDNCDNVTTYTTDFKY